MAKRANGEGTIGRYKDRWRALISYKDINGKTKRKAIYGLTQGEVKRKSEQFKRSLNNGVLQTNGEITLSQWFHDWLFMFRKNELKPSSFERYEGIYRNYIRNSTIGNMKLVDIRTINIQNYYNTLMNKEGKQASTVKSINKYLKVCINDAIKQGYIQNNFCTNIKLPKINKKKEIHAYTLEEQKLLLLAVKEHRLYALFLMALGTGLRQGELLALKWNDIDFEEAIVKVNKSIRQVNIFEDEYKKKLKLIEQQPKTESSIREVNIPNNVLKALEIHKVKQQKEKDLADDAYNDNDYIFCTVLGKPLDSRNVIRIYKRLLVNHGVPYKKFHSLRHTYATRLFEADVPVKTVQALMGHSDITTTMNIYTHVTQNVKSKAVDKINDIFNI